MRLRVVPGSTVEQPCANVLAGPEQFGAICGWSCARSTLCSIYNIPARIRLRVIYIFDSVYAHTHTHTHSVYSTIHFATVAWAARDYLCSPRALISSHASDVRMYYSGGDCACMEPRKLHGRGRTKQSRAARRQVRWENGAATATVAATVASVSSRDSRCATKRGTLRRKKSTAIHSPGVASSSGTYGQVIPSRLRLCDGHNESWCAYTSAEKEEVEEGGTAPYRRATGAGLVRSSARHSLARRCVGVVQYASNSSELASQSYCPFLLPCCWLHYMYATTTTSSDDGVFVHVFIHTYVTQLYLRERERERERDCATWYT
uniref:Uncharacterized protein n=1 Tax=Trichogramma kaykai TaxID=54128 RepID=A0ABD2VWJ2_9HYME